MEMVYEMVDSRNLLGVFDLPPEMRNRAVEVIIRDIERNPAPAKKGSAFGCMHRFADPSKIAGEDGAWERAVVEKYAKD